MVRCSSSCLLVELDLGEPRQPAQRHVEDVVGLDLGQVEDRRSAARGPARRCRCRGSAGSPRRCRGSRAAGPSTRWSRSAALPRRYVERRRTTSKRCSRKTSSISLSPSVRGWPSTSATALMPKDSSIGVLLNSCSRIASGWKPFLTSITSRRPFSRSVRSLTSAMPCSFLVWTSFLIAAMTRSVPTPYGQLGDHDALAPRGHRLDPGGGAHPEAAAAGLVGVADAVEPDDLAAGRQVGAGDEAHQRVEVGLGVLDQVPQRLDHLDQVVRRDVGGHADRDAGGAVDHEVRDRRGQHGRLELAAVVVGPEVDGVLVDGRGHRDRGRSHPGLGVAHRGGRVVGRAEVAVAVDGRQPHREGLRHPDQGVVDGAVAVRVEPAHDLADDAGGLHVPAVGAQAHVVHRVEDPALHRLQAVAGVGEGPGVDDRVGVLQEAGPHLVADVDVDDVLLEVLRVVVRYDGPCGDSPNRPRRSPRGHAVRPPDGTFHVVTAQDTQMSPDSATPRDYPEHWEADVLLRDGRTAHLRPIRPGGRRGARGVLRPGLRGVEVLPVLRADARRSPSATSSGSPTSTTTTGSRSC